MKRRKHKRHAKVVTSKSGRKYRKSSTSRTGWVKVGKVKKRHAKKRHAKKRKATKRRHRTSKFW